MEGPDSVDRLAQALLMERRPDLVMTALPEATGAARRLARALGVGYRNLPELDLPAGEGALRYREFLVGLGFAPYLPILERHRRLEAARAHKPAMEGTLHGRNVVVVGVAASRDPHLQDAVRRMRRAGAARVVLAVIGQAPPLLGADAAYGLPPPRPPRPPAARREQVHDASSH